MNDFKIDGMNTVLLIGDPNPLFHVENKLGQIYMSALKSPAMKNNLNIRQCSPWVGEETRHSAITGRVEISGLGTGENKETLGANDVRAAL